MVSSERLGAMNGVLTGISQAVATFGVLATPGLWELLLANGLPQIWPLGRFFAWNVFGIICISGFGLAWWIREPLGNAEHN
jgi:hypothetical protein